MRLLKDQFSLLLLAAGILLLALFFPWLMLRPNRLALGTPVGLPPFATVVGALVACGMVLWGWLPRLVWLGSSTALFFGVLCLGQQAASAVLGLPVFARVSAHAGFWLWMLGAGIGFYVALLSVHGWMRWAAW
ncbi:MAG: ABC transporter permease, partial [Deinococcales bacterium]